jgi:hypothetical protein
MFPVRAPRTEVTTNETATAATMARASIATGANTLMSSEMAAPIR